MRRLVIPLLLVALIGVPIGVAYLLPKSPKADRLTAVKDTIARRDFPAARKDLDAHLARNPDDREAHLLAAQTARRADDGASAEKHLQRFVTLGGSADTAERERAMRRYQNGEIDDATGVLGYCSANPNDPLTLLMLEALARGIILAGSPAQGVACLDLWLTHPLSPADREQGFLWRGQALEKMGRAPEAATDYRSVLAIDPDHAETRFRLAEFQMRDDPREALLQYQRLDRETPGRPEVLLGLACCRRQLGDHEAAAPIIAKLLAERPNDLDVLAEAGTLALDRGKPAEAEAPLRKAVALAPLRLKANVQLLRCLQELGKVEEASVQRSKIAKIEEELQRRIDAMTRKP